MHTKAKTRLMLIWLILAMVLLCSISITLIFASTNQTLLNIGVQFDSPNSLEKNDLESLFTFTSLSDTEVSIKANSGVTLPTTFIIPKTYNGKTITTIADSAFSGQSSMEKIVIQDNITSIGDKILDSCSSLTTIEIISENAKYHSSGNCIIETASKTLITGCKNSVIPTDGSVTSIGSYAFYNCTNLENITIPDGVTTIGSYAFYKCTSLKGELNIPNSVTSIGGYAFNSCSGLTSVIIPESVTTMGTYVFESCSGLTSAIINSGKINYDYGVGQVVDRMFQYCSELVTVTLPAAPVRIVACAFYGCTALETVNNSEWISQIDYAGFQNCEKLTSITFGKCSGLTLNDYAFQNCKLLKTVTMPTSGVIKVNFCAFQDCSALETIINPIHGAYASSFENCKLLTSITIDKTSTWSGTRIEEYAFKNCEKLESIILPDYLTSIGVETFYNCQALTSVVIPDSVTEIEGSAFQYSGLKSITIPSSVTTMGESVFQNCTALTDVTINSATINIDNNKYGQIPKIFTGCTALQTVTMPKEGKISINASAFQDCKSLKTVTMPTSGVVMVNSKAFQNCTALTTINNPIHGAYGYSFDGCSALTSITIGKTSIWSSTNIDQYAFRGCTNLESIVLPSYLTSIGIYAFHKCSSLTNIVFESDEESTLTLTLDEYSFLECTSLKTVTMPKYYSVTLNRYVFNGCSSLKEVTMPISGVVQVNYRAFYNCIALTAINNPIHGAYGSSFEGCSSLTSITIGSTSAWSGTNIDQYAFKNCTALKSIVLPSYLVKIGYQAFYNCSDLTSVYYMGTASEWSNITINSGNSNLTGATKYYYSKTQPSDSSGNYWHYNNGEIEVW